MHGAVILRVSTQHMPIYDHACPPPYLTPTVLDGTCMHVRRPYSCILHCIANQRLTLRTATRR